MLMSDQSYINLRCVVKSMSSAKTIAAVLCTLCVICLILVLVYQYVKLRNFADHAYLPPCYSGASGGEWGERDVAYKFTDPDACVLEFGGGSGSVSLVVQRILENPHNHVVVQPADNSEMFGGYNKLCENQQSCSAAFTIIDHVLQAGEAPQVLDLVSKPFDLIIADCEGCLLDEYNKNPSLFEHVKMIQVERDDVVTRKDYSPLFETLCMRRIFSGPHSGRLTVEVWVR